MTDITAVLNQYQESLGNLNNQLANATTRGIQLDVELKNLIAKKDEMIRECEDIAGVPYDRVNEVLEAKTRELSDLLNDFDGINCDIDTMTEEDIKKLNALAAKYVAEG